MQFTIMKALLLLSFVIFSLYITSWISSREIFSFDDTLTSNKGRFEVAIARAILQDQETISCVKRLVRKIIDAFSNAFNESGDTKLQVTFFV